MSTPNNKFIVQCYIGNQLRQVSDHHLSFSDESPARAKLVIKGHAEPNQLIAVELGWGDSVHRCFTGFIERVAPETQGYSTIFCRELSAILYRSLNLALRNPTLHQILSGVTLKTGIQFVVPDKGYSQTQIPCYYSIGNGYYLLDNLGSAFNIQNFFWQQQGNGQVFVGSWDDSRWADSPVEIPSQLLNPTSSPKSFKTPCMPQLKPSLIVNGARLSAVSHSGTESLLAWT